MVDWEDTVMQAADSEAHGCLLCDRLFVVGAKTYLLLLNSDVIIGEQITYNSASGILKQRVRVPGVRTEDLDAWDRLQRKADAYLTNDAASEADFFAAAHHLYRTATDDPTALEAVAALLNNLAAMVVIEQRTGTFAVQFSSYRVYPATLQPINVLL